MVPTVAAMTMNPAVNDSKGENAGVLPPRLPIAHTLLTPAA
jgi:hypothetical protein